MMPIYILRSTHLEIIRINNNILHLLITIIICSSALKVTELPYTTWGVEGGGGGGGDRDRKRETETERERQRQIYCVRL